MTPTLVSVLLCSLLSVSIQSSHKFEKRRSSLFRQVFLSYAPFRSSPQAAGCSTRCVPVRWTARCVRDRVTVCTRPRISTAAPRKAGAAPRCSAAPFLPLCSLGLSFLGMFLSLTSLLSFLYIKCDVSTSKTISLNFYIFPLPEGCWSPPRVRVAPDRLFEVRLIDRDRGPTWIGSLDVRGE